MIAEALELLAEQAQQADSPSILPEVTGQDPRKRFIHELLPVEINPPPRRHVVTTLLSLANAIGIYKQNEDWTIWCSLKSVIAVLGDAHGSFLCERDTITLQLQPSPLWEIVEKLGQKPMTQVELFRKLKHDLGNANVEPESFSLAVENLKFSTETTGEVTTAKTTMGRSVMAEARNTASIPEEITISFDPFPGDRIFDKPFMVHILCSVFVDAQECRIIVAPKPGELETERSRTLDALCLRIAEVTAAPGERVLAGTP